MNTYFQAAIQHQLERGKSLYKKIPKNLPREFHLLAQTCTNELSQVLDQLQMLLDNPKMAQPEFQPIRLREYRRLVDDMAFIETVGIAALERSHPNDEALNRLIELIRTEISYPLLPPVVTSLSQQYFYINPKFGLMCVPLAEGDFLLHLPDLYHELAHPLAIQRHDPRVKPFQDALLKAISIVLQYVTEEKQKEERRRGPEQLRFYLYLWEKSWWKWVIELFCDLFGVYTVGPAYAWAHLHLCTQMGSDLFMVPTTSVTSHPPDNARMKAILYGLNKMGYSEKANQINARWNDLVKTSGSKPEPEYRRCVPDSLLENIAQLALEGVSAIGCTIAGPDCKSPVYQILNEAWDEFWKNPQGYPSWERAAVTKLRTIGANTRP